MKYIVLDSDGNLIGSVNADAEDEALRAAKAQGMKDAHSVEEKPEHDHERF